MTTKSNAALFAAALLLTVLLAATSHAKTFDAGSTPLQRNKANVAKANRITSRVSRKTTHCRKNHLRADGDSRSSFIARRPSTWAWGGTMGLLLLAEFALLWRQIARMRSAGV